MKIDRLIEKTTEKDEAKKWKVVVGIVVGLVLACGLFVGGYVVTEPIVDEYLLGYSEGFILFNFYDDMASSNETNVYFIGNSNMATQIYVPEIDEILEKEGYDISSYNLYVPSDSPRQRALQIESIIRSNPSFVIYGISYSSLVHTTLYEEQILLSNEYVNLTDDLSKLYTNEELEAMSQNKFYKRGYLLRSILPADWDFTLTHFHPDNQIYVKEPFNPVWTEKVSQNKDLEAMYQSSLDIDNGWRPEITQADSLGKEVIRYTVKEFQDAGIPLIFVNMPIHPYLSAQISGETRQNTFDFLNSTGVEWYDYETCYTDNHFRDLIHVTYDGSLNFSKEMADLIIQEMS